MSSCPTIESAAFLIWPDLTCTVSELSTFAEQNNHFALFSACLPSAPFHFLRDVLGRWCFLYRWIIIPPCAVVTTLTPLLPPSLLFDHWWKLCVWVCAYVWVSQCFQKSFFVPTVASQPRSLDFLHNAPSSQTGSGNVGSRITHKHRPKGGSSGQAAAGFSAWCLASEKKVECLRQHLRVWCRPATLESSDIWFPVCV